MLSDEEREALEILNNTEWDCFMITIKNLIEIQSKEIEELKKYEKYYEEMEEVNKKFIAVDKIKAKKEELQEDIKYSANPLSIDNSKFGIKVLQSLFEKE